MTCTYYDGKVPQRIASGSPWPGAKFALRTPGAARLLAVLDRVGGDRHQGDERDLDGGQDAAEAGAGVRVFASGRKSSKRQIEPRVYSGFGGFHLVDVSDAEVSSIVTRFRDKWMFERVAAGHCTGEFAFSEFNRVFVAKFDRTGVGMVIALPR